ncbi:hypothetical protein [Bacillus thuringiensis]|uniref:hypothetical protein n=1 Tax=Bacillus thuringiensis TaxID=1428 RepID=UPI000BF7BA6C|nr:hypothetical protein [Bacillus thuringiensis]PET15037.1 hypothetical protein CN517_26055 [Bacillus thuringiensis]
MILDVKINDRRPMVGDVVAIKWKSNRGNDGMEGYILSNQRIDDGGKTYKLLNVNGESIAFDNNTIDGLMTELSRHSAVSTFEVFPKEQFKLTLQPIGGAE